MSAPTRPGATAAPARSRTSTRTVVLVGLVVTLLLAGVVSYYASSHPDGLNSVASSLGFATTARESATAGSPLAGYQVADVGDARLSGGLAGLIGVAVVGAVMAGLVLLLRRRPATERTPGDRTGAAPTAPTTHPDA